MTGLNWLSRDIGPKGPYLRLCTSEKQFKEVLKYFKLSSSIPWLGKPSADAVTHTFENASDHHTCVVCINIDLHKRTGVEIAGLLAHEAVHVWQEHCSYYGEKSPGSEQEAYAIQYIVQALLNECSMTVFLNRST